LEGGIVKRGKRARGALKGRAVESGALAEVQSLLDGAQRKTGVDPRRRDLLIENLHLIQDRFGHIPAAHLVALAREMKLAMTEVYEVATFYHHFDVIKEGEQAPPALTVRVCDSLSCELSGSNELIKGLKQSLGDKVRVIPAPCVGRCEQAPVAVVGQNPVPQATVDKVKTLVAGNKDKCAVGKYVNYAEYRKQGGYDIAIECLNGTRDAESLIKTMENSGLRGLGGAGFPSGRKWRIVRGEKGPRVMAINIDEGEPGTFKDRHYLERDPHRFLEGMIIAAWTVQISEVYIYLRDEYAGVRAILEKEIKALQANPPCPLPPIFLRRGAGA
jgi:formate dehydrogenase